MEATVIIKETADKAKAFKAIKKIKKTTNVIGKTNNGINFKKLMNLIVLF